MVRFVLLSAFCLLASLTLLVLMFACPDAGKQTEPYQKNSLSLQGIIWRPQIPVCR